MEEQSIGEQIKEALDGRTQRWLSLKVAIPEIDVCKKINGNLKFSEDELLRIEQQLDFKISRQKA